MSNHWVESAEVLLYRQVKAEAELLASLSSLYETDRALYSDLWISTQHTLRNGTQHLSTQLRHGLDAVHRAPQRWHKQVSHQVQEELRSLETSAQLLLHSITSEADAILLALATTDTDPINKMIPPSNQAQKRSIFIPPTTSSSHSTTSSSALSLFLAKHGGTCLGWSSEDHQVFLKHVTTGRTEGDTVTLLSSLLPHIQQNEILEHVHQYTHYTHLVARSRVELQAYKQQKQYDDEEESNLVQLRQQQEQLIQKKKQDLLDRNRLIHANDVKEVVTKWRRQKDEESAQQKAVTKQDEEMRRLASAHEANKKIENHKRNMKKKKESSCQEGKDNREVATTFGIESEEVQSRKVAANRVALQRRWQADTDRTSLRVSQCHKKSLEMEMQQQHLNHAAKTLFASKREGTHHDKNRLLQPTVSTMQRRSTIEEHCDAFRGPMYFTPRNHKSHRSVVPWCGQEHMR